MKWDFYLHDYNGNRAVELGLEIPYQDEVLRR